MAMPNKGFGIGFFGGEPTLYQHNETGAKTRLQQYDMYFEVANLRLGRSGEKPLE